jgi:hypothetical protein
MGRGGGKVGSGRGGGELEGENKRGARGWRGLNLSVRVMGGALAVR